MPTIQNKLFPFRQYDENEVVNLFSMDVTGLAGTFVTMVANDPSNTDGWSPSSVGASYDGMISLRYEVKSKVTAAASGATKYNVLGVTLFDTFEVDNNGLQLKFNPQRKLDLQCVVSGEAVPVLKRGIVTLAQSAYIGSPDVGKLGAIAGSGKLVVVDAANVGYTGVTTTFTPDKIVGRFLSSTGSQHGGFALFSVEL